MVRGLMVKNVAGVWLQYTQFCSAANCEYSQTLCARKHVYDMRTHISISTYTHTQPSHVRVRARIHTHTHT